MPVSRDYILEEDPDNPYPIPPPNTPQTQPSGGGGSIPSGGGGEVAPAGPTGGGGGYLPPPPRPSFPGVNIPGAPVFNAPKFVAPDRAALMLDPGYQARLDAGSSALDRSAAARGSLRGGAQIRAQQEYGQNFGSQEFAQAYNRGLQQYDRDYQAAKDVYAPAFARWQQQAEANRQGGLMGYQTDLNYWLQKNTQPAYHDPGPDWSEILGPDPLPPAGAPSGGYGGGGGYGYGGGQFDEERYRNRGY